MQSQRSKSPKVQNGFSFWLILVLVLSLFALVPPKSVLAQSTILRVNANVVGGSNDGSSWVNAYADLQEALAVANPGDQIWVAAGTYYPGAARENSFAMRNGVEIYGGFAGNETLLGERDWRANVTVLSGDINQSGTLAGNSLNVINNIGLDATAVLDGFTITGGNMDTGAANDRNGGGIRNTNSSPTLRNLIIHNNQVTDFGGGIYNNNSSPTLINVVISGNVAVNAGGGISNDTNSSPTLINVTISGNRTNDTPASGGGIENYGNSNPNIRNSIIWDNVGGQIISTGGAASTPVVNNSIVQGGWAGAGAGNLALNPQFIAPVAPGSAPTAAGNYRLQSISPAINAGSNDFVPGDLTTDLDGNPRTIGGTVDIGAFEWQPVIYVRPGGTGAGGSWQNARDLAAALANAQAGQELWVATGTYAPGNARADSFVLRNNVALYGGFAGTETAREDRDWVTNVVTLTGDIGTPGDVSDNSFHVVLGNALNNSAILDGFTITGGNANEDFTTNRGGGIRNSNGSPTLRNLIVRNNHAMRGGGGIYNWAGSPVISNVLLLDNRTEIVTEGLGFGGALFNEGGSHPILTNVIISGNQAREGGAIFNAASNPTLTNVLISGNFVSFNAAGIANNNSNPTLTNVTISGNRAANWGGGIVSWGGSSTTVRNSIIWGNLGGTAANIGGDTPTVSYSIVQGGYPGTGNLDSDPLFVNPIAAGSAPTDTGDYRLQPSSPAVNFGDNALIPSGVTTDLAGNPRIIGTTVDMGAYEALPAVLSINRAGANPTNAATVGFTVTFNMPVTGVDAGDFAMILTDGQVGSSISDVSGSGTTWLVEVATQEAVGTIGLNLVDNDTIQTNDTPPVPLGGMGLGNGNFTGQVYDVYRVPPTVTISPPSLSITNSGPVTYAVNFDGATTVTFTNTDVTLNTSGTATGSVAVTGSAPDFVVTISDIVGTGTLSISVAAGVAADPVGNLSLATDSAAFTVDNTPPTVSISDPSATATNTGPVTYTVTFTDATIYNFTPAAVTLNATDSATGTVTIFGSGPEFLVEISGITGDGALGISIAAGAASDTVGNLSPAVGPSTTFDVDNTPPTVSISDPSATATNTGPVTYTVTFTDATIYNFTPATVTLNATDSATGTVTIFGSGPEFLVEISGITGDGALGISIAAGAASDAAGNFAPGATSTTFTVDNTPPTITITGPSQSMTSTDPVTYAVSFEGASDYPFDDTFVTLTATGDATGTATVSGSGSEFVVTISAITGNGTLRISVGAGAALDAVGNPSPAAGPSDPFTVDNAPVGLTLGPPSSELTISGPVTFPMTFTNATTVSLTPAGVSINSASVTGDIAVVNGTTANPSVTVDNLVGNGTFTISIAAGIAFNAIGTPNEPSGPSAAVTVDQIPPGSPIVTGTTPTNNPRPTWDWVSGGGGGDGRFRYRLNNSDLSAELETSATSFTPTTDLSDGSHILYVQERDLAGNWSASGFLEIVIDTSVPNAPIVTSTTNITNSTTPTWSWTAQGGGNGTFRYRLNDSDLSTGATETNATSFTPTAPLDEGIHTLYVQERNAAETWSPSGSFAIEVDTTPPTVSLSTTSPSLTNVSPIPVTVNFSEPVSGFTATDVSLINATLSDFVGSGASYSFNMIPQSEGLVTASIGAGVANDAAGNPNQPSASLSIEYNTTAPIVNITTPTPINVANAASYTVSGTCDASAGTVSVTVGSVPGTAACSAGSFSLTLNVSSVPDGASISITASQTDAANNTGTVTASALKDTVPPSTSISAPSLIRTNSGPVTYTVSFADANTHNLTVSQISLEATGTATGSVMLDGSGPTYIVTIHAISGDGTLSIRVAAGGATDLAGNPSSAAGPSASFDVDNTAPNPPIVTGETPTNNTMPAWSWESGGGEGAGFFRYRLNNPDLSAEPETDATSFTPETELSEGAHILYVQERDTVGNWSESGSHEIVIDISIPNRPIVTGETPTNNTRPTWSWEPGGGGNGFFRHRLNDPDLSAESETSTTSFSPTTALDEGTHTLYVQERNEAGTWSASGEHTILIDTTAPTVTLSTTLSSPTNVSPVPVDVSFSEPVSGFVTTSVTLENATLITLTGSGAAYSIYLVPENQGLITITIGAGVVNDAAGNPNEASAPLSIEYNTTAPIVSIAPALPVNRSTVTNYAVEGTCDPTASAVTVSIGAVSQETPCASGNYSTTLDLSNEPDGPISIRAEQSDSAGNVGYATATSFKDVVDPTVSISAPSLALSNHRPVSYTVSFEGAEAYSFGLEHVSLTATDSASATLALSGEGPSFIVTLDDISGDGTLAISVTAGAARDAAGNEAEGAGPSESFTVDNTPPTVSIGTPALTLTNQGPVDFPISIAEAAEINLTPDDVSFTPSAGVSGEVVVLEGTSANPTVRIENLSGDGSFSISLGAGFAHDAAGNPSLAVGPSVEVTVDNTAPTLSISPPSLELTNSGPVTYTVIFTGAERYAFNAEHLSLNATGSATATVAVSGNGPTFTVTLDAITGDGMLDISIMEGAAHDAAGNPNPATGPSASFNVDNTAPTLRISSTVGNPTDVSPMPFTVSFSEQVFGFSANDLTLTNASVSNFTGSGANYSFRLTPQNEGPVTVTIGANVARDAAGNPNLTGDSFSVVYNASPPAVRITPLGPINAANAGSYTIAGTCANDAGDVTVKVGTFSVVVPCNAGNFSITLDLHGIPDGDKIAISAHQTNVLGKLGRSEVTVVKDVVLPRITINTLEAINASNVGRYTVSGTCSEGEGDVVVELGSLNATVGCNGGVYSTNFNLRNLPDGSEISVRVSQTDAVGNRDATEFVRIIKDVSPPRTTILSGPDNQTTSRTARFEFSGSDGDGSGIARFECSLNNAPFQTCTSPHTLNDLPTGNHVLHVRAIDRAGNVEPNPPSYRWIIRSTTLEQQRQHVFLPLVVR
ncbi:beta strand repeat-containing protein [Candidatus Viridilinea mediisalina]|uniref:Bacterial Ig-like domain-containing protein n=1 Tax=Candidatus Viridilinea mediisalina TaxID=2024553 RepID=A0A2A6RHE8_9CHLR|nr:Ig-like domain-containing protein [Candidatus Viridilinea mediisalina]PDW02309.1 hypothetical protein CJ255_14700 [Candidatus Viridilinea mediisalina]